MDNVLHLESSVTNVAKEITSHNLSICPSEETSKYPNDSGDNEDDLLVDTISNNQPKNVWEVTLTVNSLVLSFKIETGAQCNVISKTAYNFVSKSSLTKSNAKLVAFGGHKKFSFTKSNSFM